MNPKPNAAGRTSIAARARFILVKDRVPRMDGTCARCCVKIANGYVREPQTRLVYCNLTCFTGHGKIAMSALVNRVKRAS